MKTALILLAAILPFLQQWEEYTNLEGRFKILAPGRLEEKTDTIMTALGNLASHTFYLQDNSKEANNLFYLVSYTDYPAGIFENDTTHLVEEFLKVTMEEAASSVNGEIVYEANLPLGDHPGKQWRIDYMGGKVVIKSRAYLVGSRMYSLRTITWKEKSLNVDANRFLDSFKLL